VNYNTALSFLTSKNFFIALSISRYRKNLKSLKWIEPGISCIIKGVSDVPFSDKEEDKILQGIKFRENTPMIMETLLNIVLPFLLSIEKI
jgi:hypothetical protein